MKAAFYLILAATSAGCCITTPSNESVSVVTAIAAIDGCAVEQCDKADINMVCKAIDDAFTKDELMDLCDIFSDEKVRELVHSSPIDVASLDARIREIAKTDAIFKFCDAELQETISKSIQKGK